MKVPKNSIVGRSRFWKALWEEYPGAPSIALCRVPELEYASTLDVGCSVLDHCCGDGRFSSLAWPGQTITAGCDIDEHAVEKARHRGNYQSLEVCDASRILPFDNAAFDLVFNNSGLEHIANIDRALAEIARVLRPGGTFAFSVLNNRYFDWWPLDSAARDHYRTIQPFHHALSLSQWDESLTQAGLKIEQSEGYFNRRASRRLAWLDYHFSNAYLSGRRSLLVSAYTGTLPLAKVLCRRLLGSLSWKTEPGVSAGYFIKAVREHA